VNEWAAVILASVAFVFGLVVGSHKDCNEHEVTEMNANCKGKIEPLTVGDRSVLICRCERNAGAK
jgi:hypothetical protein